MQSRQSTRRCERLCTKHCGDHLVNETAGERPAAAVPGNARRGQPRPRRLCIALRAGKTLNVNWMAGITGHLWYPGSNTPAILGHSELYPPETHYFCPNSRAIRLPFQAQCWLQDALFSPLRHLPSQISHYVFVISGYHRDPLQSARSKHPQFR
jgi:hypothetical protein